MITSVELQKAVYKELEKDIYPVQEVVSQDFNELPMITIQDLNKNTNFTKTNKDRFTFSITIHGWSVGRSSIEIKEIENFIYQTIMDLEMETYNVELVNLSMNSNIRDEETANKIVFHSIQEFEITISKIKETN